LTNQINVTMFKITLTKQLEDTWMI